MTHPILPTQKQFVEWDSEYFDEEGSLGERQNFDFMMLKAFQAGADRQLEQVLRFMEENGFGIRKILVLRDAMRPQEDNS
ncbi:hypothetical protein [Limnobacter sp.]|uniref:hypothetical protein n=1 Tax=Limnobacter sp. TaxID=2003368 RepID=UPI0025B8DEFB|nr:hypothetical protein [Limnobacter sp.]